jgi:hypothetical protein
MRTLIRAVLILVVLVAVAALFLGYWTGSSFNRPVPAAHATEPVRPEGGTARIDTDRAREIGAEAGAKVAEAGARASAEIGDAAVTARIKAKMALDDYVKARDIIVNTDGSTVTLRGEVHSAQERERAVRLARETAGITKVVDELRIRP